jgi:hypothetical protein
MPSSSPWLTLIVGVAVTLLSFLPNLLFQSRSWLVVSALWGVVGVLTLVRTRGMQALVRRTRVRFQPRGAAPVLRVLHARWEAAGILSPRGATAGDIRRFEHEYGVVLPDDVRAYFATINGTARGEAGRDDEDLVGFWHLDQVRTFAETHVATDAEAHRTFAFADYLCRFAVFGIRLSDDVTAPTRVVARFPYGQFDIASTFGEFLTRYVLDDLVLLPAFSVVADDEGLGAEVDGVVSYVVHWPDVHRIDVEVVVAKDLPAESILVWVIAGEAALHPFVAPVDTVAGGHIVRAKILSLPGFDESAFAAARSAEARCEAGTFTVWRRAEPPTG